MDIISGSNRCTKGNKLWSHNKYIWISSNWTQLWHSLFSRSSFPSTRSSWRLKVKDPVNEAWLRPTAPQRDLQLTHMELHAFRNRDLLKQMEFRENLDSSKTPDSIQRLTTGLCSTSPSVGQFVLLWDVEIPNQPFKAPKSHSDTTTQTD